MNGIPSSEFKFLRAQEHLEQLRLDHEWFIKGGPATISNEFDEHSGHRRFWISRLDHLPAKWPALVGDCLQDFRSALDHKVFELDMRPEVERDLDRDLCFPIYRAEPSEQDWRKRIGSPRPGVETALKAVQPYKRREQNPDEDPLWWLHVLARKDRHRRLQFISWRSAVDLRKDDQIIDSWPSLNLEVGTEIGSFDPNSPEADPDVKLSITMQVAFAEDPVRNQIALAVLHQISANVRSALDRISQVVVEG